MSNIFVLLDVHLIILNQNYSPFIILRSTVFRRAENRNYWWKGFVAAPPVHLITIHLYLMCTDYRYHMVLFQDSFSGFVSKFYWTFSFSIFSKIYFSGCWIVQRIWPKKITQKTLQGRFS